MRGRRKLTHAWERPPKGRSLSKWERLAYERHARDLAHGHERGLWFDDAAADRAVAFIQGYLKHTVGEWAGRPFVLIHWQLFIVRCLFGWKRADGTRRFRYCYIQVARKNGKTTLLAAIVLYLLLADREPGAQVYSIATKRDQAKIVFNEAARMVRRSRLAELVEVHGGKPHSRVDNISCDALASYFQPLSSEDDTLDGLNTHGLAADEVHAWKHQELWDVLDTSTGARRQPLIVAITTPGVGQHGVCWSLRLHAGQLLEGIVANDTFFGYVCEPEPDADWTEPETWEQGNPNLGVSVKLEDLRQKCDQAREIPAQQNGFRRLRCGQWTEQIKRAIPLDLWDACGGEFDPAILHGRPAYGGLDLASTTDLAAFELVFPPVDDRPWYYVLTWAFLPEDGLANRARVEQVPLTTWRDQGHLITTPGNEIDYGTIRATIQRAAELYDVREIAFDPWNATKLVQELTDEDGLTMVKVSQGVGGMSGPTKETLHLIRQRVVRHGSHPVLRWCAANLALWEDTNANTKPSRKSSGGRIDCMVALIMACGRASLQAEAGSVYETRGLA